MSTTVTPPIDTDPTDADQQSPLAHLSAAQLEELAGEFDAIRDRVAGELGERDRRYIEAMIEMQRRLAVIGRVGLLLPRFRPLAAGGAAALAAAKILENMEIGHNVMHGQWDWMNDPRIHSSTWDWDNASTAEAWKHSHNYVHHTFTNIRGKDKDLGYEIMRIDPHQGWHPVYLLQPLYNLVLAGLFEWGVAVHDLDFDAIRSGKKPMPQVKRGAARDRRQGARPGGQGLHRLAADERPGERRGRGGGGGDEARTAAVAPTAAASRRAASAGSPAGRSPTAPRPTSAPPPPTRAPTWPATSGPTRSSSAATSPTRPTPTARPKSRTRAAAAGTSASSPAPPTSRARRSSTSPAATSATRSSTTSSPTCRAAATPRSPPR